MALESRPGATERRVRASLDVAPVPGRPGARGLVRWKHPVSGDAHRPDGPAIHRPGEYEAWFIDGIRHREDGPAVLTVSHEVWWRFGVMHRLNGPASQILEGSPVEPEDGNGREWHVTGIRVEPEDGCEHLDELYDSGRTELLELVLSMWRPGGPTIPELADAVEAATA